ncbi:MAG: F0F1 ATP synthase subunit B' [Pseudomonadota bacterium]
MAQDRFLLAAAEAADAADKGGLPQLDPAVWPTQIFWLIVTLAVLYLMLSRIAIPRIQATLDERQDAIAADLDLATDFSQRAKQAEAAYEKALEDARGEARAIADKAQAEIREQLDAAIARADAQIAEKAAESQGRLAEIQARAATDAQAVAREVAAALAARLSPVAVDGGSIDAAVSARVAERFGGAP